MACGKIGLKSWRIALIDAASWLNKTCVKTPSTNCAASLPACDAICAVVVAYYPEHGFEERLRELLPQVGALVIADNTPIDRRERKIVVPNEGGKRVCVIENQNNLGVGAALNQGLDQALRWNYEWILTLDQDTLCLSDMMQTLVAACSGCHPRPAVVGSNYLDPRNNRSKVPTNSDREIYEQKTVITSGSLVDAVFARAIGGFREDYFIDQLDHEFCLRARSHGGRVIISHKPVMLHSVGDSGGAWVPYLGHLPNHPPLRKYYIARNSLVTIIEYWRSEPDWCLRRLARLLMGAVSMLLLEKRGFSKIRAFAFGIADAMGRRMGPCRRESLFDK